MKKHFYTHLVEIDSLYISLDLLEMKDEERKELTVIIESSIHHVVLDTVLSRLSDQDKKAFLAHVAADRHEEVWSLLKTKARNIEKHIQKAVEKLKNDFHKDIKKSKTKRR
jgi:hypothetical protein